MVTLKRLTVGDMIVNPTLTKLTQEEMHSFTGGDGTDDWADGGYGKANKCLYDCISYIGRFYGYDRTPDWYSTEYVYGSFNKDDDWAGSGNFNDAMRGPDMYKDNELNGDIYSYMTNFFDTSGSGWVTESDTQNSFGTSDDGTKVMGVYMITDPETGKVGYHAVILESFENGVYSYYDPSNNTRGTIEKSVLMGSIVTNGPKQK